MRWFAAILLIGCAGTAPVRTRAPLAQARVIVEAAPPEPLAPLEERAARARDEAIQQGAAILDERRERLDGEARMHLVLAHGRCYRAWIGADGAFTARLEDEHGHEIADGASESSLWLDPVCPRWSGSFALVVNGENAFDLDVLLISSP